MNDFFRHAVDVLPYVLQLPVQLVHAAHRPVIQISGFAVGWRHHPRQVLSEVDAEAFAHQRFPARAS